MEQMTLVHEDIYEALRTCVQALGGSKKVGVRLWPELAADKAGNRLSDALNAGKRDVLNPEQVMLILRESRRINCHVAMYYLADACDYHRPDPLEPSDELALLQREYIQSVKQQQQLAKRMEQMLSLREVGT